jgi:Chromo (CHRromatin Organisation MOdifier) domain
MTRPPGSAARMPFDDIPLNPSDEGGGWPEAPEEVSADIDEVPDIPVHGWEEPAQEGKNKRKRERQTPRDRTTPLRHQPPPLSGTQTTRSGRPVKRRSWEDESFTQQEEEPAPDTDTTEYIVQKILEERGIGVAKQYLVKWRGYPDPTWNDASEMEGAKQLIQEFKRRKAEERQQEARNKRKPQNNTIRGSFLQHKNAPEMEHRHILSAKTDKDQYDYRLHPKIFYKIQQKFGTVSIDVFASRTNRQTKFYCTADMSDNNAFARDAFTANWGRFTLPYFNPPFDLIRPTLQKMRRDHVGHAIVVTPLLAMNDWYTQLWEWSVQQPLLLPRSSRVFMREESELPYEPPWPVVAWKVSTAPSDSQRFKFEKAYRAQTFQPVNMPQWDTPKTTHRVKAGRKKRMEQRTDTPRDDGKGRMTGSVLLHRTDGGKRSQPYAYYKNPRHVTTRTYVPNGYKQQPRPSRSGRATQRGGKAHDARRF